MRIEMWPPWGGVIGDKVTLMFRLFNSHLFVRDLLCVQFKSHFFSPGKSNVPRNRHKGTARGVSNVPRMQSCHFVNAVCGRGPTTRPFLSDRQLFPAVLHRAAFLRFSTFFQPIAKRPLWKNMGFHMS